MRAAQQTGILVYALGRLGETGREATARAKSELDLLTKATGGQAYYLEDVAAAEGVAREIAHDLPRRAAHP
jgi:hypothetical protein